jgi:hypothetical protein
MRGEEEGGEMGEKKRILCVGEASLPLSRHWQARATDATWRGCGGKKLTSLMRSILTLVLDADLDSGTWEGGCFTAFCCDEESGCGCEMEEKKMDSKMESQLGGGESSAAEFPGTGAVAGVAVAVAAH